MRRELLIVLLLCCTTPTAVVGDEREFFESRVRPLLIKHCLECHGAKKQESGLRLDSREGWTRGGDRGVAVIPGKAKDSLLMTAVGYTDPELKMPPDGKLLPAEIADLTAWINRGAHDPRTDEGARNAAARMSLEEAKLFWSFQPISAPTVPAVEEGEWLRTRVDAFVLARLKERGLTPLPDADKRTLIRRATFDLTGLPPTPDEIAAFLNDKSPEAFDAVVERLLESAAYGERWGRHWLDVARYADTAGDGRTIRCGKRISIATG